MVYERSRDMGCATVGELLSEQHLAALAALLRKSKGPIAKAIKGARGDRP